MKSIFISSQKRKQVVDIIEAVETEIAQVSVSAGLVNVSILHTTASITTADLDPGTDLDMLDALDEMIPKLAYRHPHDPSHVGDHIMSSIIGSSVTLPFRGGKVLLGTWQRLVMVELNGPREREIIVTIFGCEEVKQNNNFGNIKLSKET